MSEVVVSLRPDTRTRGSVVVAYESRHEVAGPEPRVRTFLHPQAGPVTFTVTELEIPVLPEARLTVYTPADEQTRARLPLTRRAR
jgi:MmyB-like transcription regulator ligand binding domain